MQICKISINEAKKVYEKLACDKTGISILNKKTKLHTLFIKDLHVGAANILKQDALSIGADLAVPSGVIVASKEYYDAILIGTTKHIELLSKKELSQPYGLKELAKELKKFTKSKKYPIKIMGVLNANEDSFFSKSRFESSNAINRIEQMIENGANIIDIGGVSSRPGSLTVSIEEELKRVKPIIDLIKKQKLYEKVNFSLDSYEPEVLKYALDSGFNIVNDITGLANDEVCKVAAEYKAKTVIMHMQKNPKNMQENPYYENVILDIDNFFKTRIEKAKSFGIKDIVLDVGIGFGKTLDHNLILLNNLEHFKHFSYEILMGASRKSMINAIIPTEIKDRLPATLAIHLKSIENGASIIRCHDVKEHFQAIKTLEAINNIEIL